MLEERAVAAHFERRLDAIMRGLGGVYECSVFGLGAGWLHDVP